MSRHTELGTWARALALAAVLALVLGLLPGCGGGDDDECNPEATPPCGKTTEPVDCRANPEKCQ